MIYDCLIVGGGPAGAILSILLQTRGFRCVLLEKRTEIDEKICGGFVPDRCRNLMLQCGVDLQEMDVPGNPIHGYMEMRMDAEKKFQYKDGKFGLGVCRKNMDSFLLKKAEGAGTTVLYGETVRNYEKKDGIFTVNGFRSRTLVWAAGAKPPVQMTLFEPSKVRALARKQSVGISEILSAADCRLNQHFVYFWYEGTTDDYFWAIPIGEHTWNIGYWSQAKRKNILEHFKAGRKKWIEENCGQIQTIRAPRGALLGNADFSACLKDESVFCCGDAAGENNIYTGEGIAQAVRSAQRTADAITEQLQNLTAANFAEIGESENAVSGCRSTD